MGPLVWKAVGTKRSRPQRGHISHMPSWKEQDFHVSRSKCYNEDARLLSYVGLPATQEGFSAAFVHFVIMTPFLSFLEQKYLLCHCILSVIGSLLQFYPQSHNTLNLYF